MTTTKTPTKANPSAELGELEAAAAAADVEVANRRQRVEENHATVNKLKAAHLGLSTESPEQFDDSGLPKSDTEAAEVVRAIEKAVNQDLGSALAGAESRAARAHDLVIRHRDANARALLLELLGKDKEADRKWQVWAIAGEEALKAKLDIAARAAAICTATHVYDPQDIPPFDPYSKLTQDVGAAAEIHSSLPRTLLRELAEEDSVD